MFNSLRALFSNKEAFPGYRSDGFWNGLWEPLLAAAPFHHYHQLRNYQLCSTDLCSNRRFSATTDSAAVVANLQSQFLAEPLGRHHQSDHSSDCHFPWVLSPLGEGQSRLMNALQGYEGLIFCHTLLSKSDQCDHWPWTPSNCGERQDGGKGLDLGQFVWSSTLLQYPHVHWARKLNIV